MSVVSSPFAVELEQLLAPITAGKPSGEDLRYDPIYDRIRNLRREEDSKLPQGVWETDRKRADWSAVASECSEALELRSKDLQIAAWLSEAWVHLYGFAGAAEGFRLMHALCDAFWDDLYPRIQDGDVEFRIAPIIWLDDRLPVQLKLIPLTAPDSPDVSAYSWADYEKASQAETKKGADGKAPEVSFTQFHQSAMLTPSRQLSATLGKIQSLLESCNALDNLLDERLGREAPGLVPIRVVAESAGDMLASLLRDRGEPMQEEIHSDQNVFAPLALHMPEEPYLPASDGPIRTRAEAYQMLTEAADFLARTEPHSPTPYLVRRAIAWGAMSLEQLLPELVTNRSDLSEIYRLLNLRSAEIEKK